MKAACTEARFICPECGSGKFVAPTPAEVRQKKPLVRRTVICASCGFEIPLHLAERWGGLSLDEAKKEWREIYRLDGICERATPAGDGASGVRFDLPVGFFQRRGQEGTENKGHAK